MAQIINVPGKMIKSAGTGIKAGAKAALAPATPGGTWQFVLGALLGAPVSSIYSYLYNASIGRLGLPPAINLGLKILFPLAPMYFVKKSKIPAGNIINGALLGVTIAQSLNALFGLLAGGMPTGNGTYNAEALTVQNNDGWFNKLM